MGDVVLLRDHPIEAVDILVPLRDVTGECVVPGPEGGDRILVHRADREVHPPQALLCAQLGGVGEVLDHDGVPGLLDHLGADDHAAEVPRDPPHERAHLRAEPDLDEVESPDVSTNEFAQEVIPTLFALLLEDAPAQMRSFHGPRSNQDRAFRFRLQEDGVPRLQSRVDDPVLRERHDIRRTTGQLELPSFHEFPFLTETIESL